MPLKVNNEQKEQFINILKKIYDPRVVKEKTLNFFTRDWRIGERIMYPREWIAEEYLVLLECDSTEKAYESIGRTWYATALKDADWRYRLISFCDKSGLNLSNDNNLEVIKKFMEAQEEFRKLHKNLRKEKKELINELLSLNSTKTRERMEFLKKIGQLTDEEFQKYQIKKKNMESRLEDTEKELEKTIDEL